MEWFIPDCYLGSKSNGENVTHEAVCILNPHDEDTVVKLTLYFEDREPADGFEINIPKRRTIHIRLDKLRDKDGNPIKRDTPYGMKIECDLKVYIQYTRVDTSQPELALMTTII
jgi:Anabaena sensory rhodopsin transducer.